MRSGLIAAVAIAGFCSASLVCAPSAQAKKLSWKRVTKNAKRMVKDVTRAPKKAKAELKRFSRKVDAEARRAKDRGKKILREIDRIKDDIKRVGRVLKKTKHKVRKVARTITHQVKTVRPHLSKTVRSLKKAKVALGSKEGRKRLFARALTKQLTGALVKFEKNGKLEKYLNKKVFGSHVRVFDLLAPQYSIAERLDPTGIRKCTRQTLTRRGLKSFHRTQQVPEPRALVAASLETCILSFLSGARSGGDDARPVEENTQAEEAALAAAKQKRDAELAKLQASEAEKKTVQAARAKLDAETARANALLNQLDAVATDLKALDARYDSVGKRAAALIKMVDTKPAGTP